MKKALRRFLARAACCAGALLLLLPAGCGRSEDVAAVRIDGSSTVFPATEAVAEEFQAAERGRVRVTVGISGTGGGFRKFARGEVDVCNASRPILREEMEACRQGGIRFIELPICFDALTIAVHPDNDWCDRITVAELKKLWEPAAQGVVTRWSHVREGWPDQPISLYGAGADSGTFDYFTEAIVGRAKSSRGDYTASEDDNTLVRGIEGDRYALGYLPYAYYAPQADRLKAVAIDSGDGEAALPSPENVVSGKYRPLSRPLFLYVNEASLDLPHVMRFVEFYLRQGPALVEEVRYLPLPERGYELGLQRLQRRQTGSAFGGTPEVGLSVEEMLTREPGQ